nr:MAG TPA: hypothetical protein [Caudoviricetes sp.]
MLRREVGHEAPFPLFPVYQKPQAKLKEKLQ